VTDAKISVIVCVKRHHTRFFPLDKGDKNGNIAVGTVVENGHGKDVFMVSHAGLQGTVRPTHYMVLYDENDLHPADFQRICNNLCYSYGRATVSVSIGEFPSLSKPQA
jgi:eukaryotic translation initiation factor 2C